MKNNIKYLLLSCLILSTDIFANYAHVIGPQVRESYTLHYGITVRQLDLCTDWACTAPFNAFTGSQYLAVNTAGVIPAYGEISVNLPNSGTYSHVRVTVDNAFVLNGYSARSESGGSEYCATGYGSTTYSTMAAAKAAATDVIYSAADLSKFLKDGTGVDAAGYGWIVYGLRDDQTSIPGYYAKGHSKTFTSEYDPYTKIIARDSGNDDFYITTVLQGDYDFGLGMPSTINFGITVLEHRGIEGGLCNSSDVEDGGCLESEIGTCVFFPGEPKFDFLIQ